MNHPRIVANVVWSHPAHEARMLLTGELKQALRVFKFLWKGSNLFKLS